MKRLLFGLLVALVIGLAGNVAQADAAPGNRRQGVDGQVKSVEGATITVQNPKATVKIATTADTTFEVNGQSGSLSDIAVGMFVRAEGSRGADGILNAARVRASSTAPASGQPPRGGPGGPGAPGGLGGQVQSVDGATITVQTPKGAVKVATTAATKIEINGQSGSLSGITAGMFVHVEGSRAADGTVAAVCVLASTERPARPPRR